MPISKLFRLNLDYHLDTILRSCAMAEGNKKAEELAKEIEQAAKDRKNPDKPAKGEVD
jgi:hypothetical protein